MGKDRSAYIKPKKSLHTQAYEQLTSMLALGESKRAAKGTEEGISGKIYSGSTYKTYKKHIGYFIDYLRETHPEVKTLKKAKKYVSEWLEYRVNSVNKDGQPLSAWTIQTEQAAVNKLYGIRPDDPDRFQAPRRRREDIRRSRGTAKRDKHFSERTNEELINFCKGTGCRRNVLEKLTGKDLMSLEDVKALRSKAEKDGNERMMAVCDDAIDIFGGRYQYFVFHRRDKGGKNRISPIIGPNAAKIIERMKNTAEDEKVWKYVSSNCDVHGYRSDYATELYNRYAHPIEDLDYKHKILCADGKYRSEIYACRGDEAGKKLDRKAIGIISKALGHNREDTAISSYVRNL